METRPPIPRPLKRAVLVEAGHRCAIPTCHQVPVDLAHIIPWVQIRKHTFDNLIALCPTCHARYDNHEIDRKAMQQYKANLCLLNSRYGDLERRVLKMFADNLTLDSVWIEEPLDILMMYLVEDGLVTRDESLKYHLSSGAPYLITEKGRQFVTKWVNAEDLK